MRISINQWSLPGSTLFKRLQWARKYGFTAVDLLCSPVPVEACGLYVPGMQLAEIRELKEALDGCESISLHAPFGEVFDTTLVSVNPKIREASLQDILLTLRFAEAVGARTITCHSGCTAAQAQPGEVKANLRDSLTRLNGEAGTVRIGMESTDWFLPLGRFELLRDLQLPNIGITLDIGYAYREIDGKPAYHQYGSVAGFIREFNDLILCVQVHDFDGSLAHIGLGDGMVDVKGIVETLGEVGYAGDLILELNPEQCGPETVLHSKMTLERLLPETVDIVV